MSLKISDLIEGALNLIYPIHCAGCKTPLKPYDHRGVCSRCIRLIRKNPMPYCTRCGRSIDKTGGLCAECDKRRPSFDVAMSACLYEDPLRELIHLFKYSRRLSILQTLSDMMIGFIEEHPEIIKDVNIVTPVPLNTWRRISRGFNQSEELALSISKALSISCDNVLRKRKITRNQNELSRDERLINLHGAFAARKKSYKVRDSVILLVDDVMTTGATLNECAIELKKAGAKEVRCLTLARGI